MTRSLGGARRRRSVLGDRLVSALPDRASDALVGVVGSAVEAVRPGTPIWARDWDVLCILDACRVDLLREHAATGPHEFLRAPGDVEAAWSVASQSAEWMDRTFVPAYRDEMARTAYVTGNPFSAQNGAELAETSDDVLPLADDDFAFLAELWRDDWQDGAISTIPPRPLTDAAIAVWREREALDVDRLVVHYMQPHAPFRGRPEWFVGDADPTDWGRADDEAEHDENERDEAEHDENERDEADELADLDPQERAAVAAFAAAAGELSDVWMRVRDGELAFDDCWAAYRDNLAWVLDDVELLLENCDAHVALTSDHGNAAGEWGVWSHPPETAIPALRRVPWVDLAGRDAGTRQPELPTPANEPPTTDDGPPTTGDDASARDGADPAATVEDRLADLGYR